MNTTTIASKCTEAGSGEHLWMEGQDGPATCHHCRADLVEETTTEGEAMHTETKVQDMTVGQNVTFPTQSGGVHSGLILTINDRGTETRMITVRYWDGSEATIRTSRRYTGYVRP